jgi:hypothetical protein
LDIVNFTEIGGEKINKLFAAKKHPLIIYPGRFKKVKSISAVFVSAHIAPSSDFYQLDIIYQIRIWRDSLV